MNSIKKIGLTFISIAFCLLLNSCSEEAFNDWTQDTFSTPQVYISNESSEEIYLSGYIHITDGTIDTTEFKNNLSPMDFISLKKINPGEKKWISSTREDGYYINREIMGGFSSTPYLVDSISNDSIYLGIFSYQGTFVNHPDSFYCGYEYVFKIVNNDTIVSTLSIHDNSNWSFMDYGEEEEYILTITDQDF